MDELEILRRQQKAQRERARAQDRSKNNNGAGAPSTSPPSPIQYHRSCLDDSPEDRQKRLERLRREERIRNGQRLMEKHGYIQKRRRSPEPEASSPPNKRSSLEGISNVTLERENRMSPLTQSPSSVDKVAPKAARQISRQIFPSNEHSTTTRTEQTQTSTKPPENVNDGYSSSDLDDEAILQMARVWRGEVVKETEQDKKKKSNSPAKETNELCHQGKKNGSVSVSSEQCSISETRSNDSKDEVIRSSKKSERISKGITNHSDDKGSSKQHKKGRTRRDDSSYDSQDDLYAYAKRFSNKRNQHDSDSSDDSCARYLRKSKRKSSSPLRNSDSTKVGAKKTKQQGMSKTKTGDDLWDDSSDDDKPLEQAQPTKKGKRKRKDRATSNECAFEDYAYDMLEADDELKAQLKPEFDNPKMGKPSALVQYILERNNTNAPKEVLYDYVPASMNRYLQEYQQKAISWMHSSVTLRKGCILGDDMGLGKTVMCISLLAALQKKTGTKFDLKVIRNRKRIGEEDERLSRGKTDAALMEGRKTDRSEDQAQTQLVESRGEFSPLLVIVPSSLLDNWRNEFETWGYFAVSVFRSAKDRDVELHRIKIGMNDILVCTSTLFSKQEHFARIEEIPWKLIIVDEFHCYKNRKTKSYQCLSSLRNVHRCPIIGMTGTLMSNNHEELWSLVDLVQPGILGMRRQFIQNFSQPIKLARAKDAGKDVRDLSERRRKDLDNIMLRVHLKRRKEDVLKNTLKEKNQFVVFCPLTPIQKTLYQNILNLPDYQILKKSELPCNCGVNQSFFLAMKKLSSKAQRINYCRMNKNSYTKRKECCYAAPIVEDEDGELIIDPRAVLWKRQHPDNEQCERCPTCTLLPALSKLAKVCSHASLIQASLDPDMVEGEDEREKAKSELEFAKVAISQDILELVPGKSYINKPTIMDDHCALSGKMKALAVLLDRYEKASDRVLLFSRSTQSLDFIERFTNEKGYVSLRLDGNTSSKKRAVLVEQFQTDDKIFVFLISTLAGGLGLNLTAANRVVIYDVNWNPSHDDQAQDRAYRIGQTRDVHVTRLVAQGTLEEQQYTRQIYKAHLTQDTLGGNEKNCDASPGRIFRGVEKDQNRKGELFGLQNLLKFKEGSFMSNVWRAKVPMSSRFQEHSESNIADNLSGSCYDPNHGLGDDEDPLNVADEDDEGHDAQPSNIQVRHEDFMRSDRGGAVLNPGDEGYDEEMGAESQMLQDEYIMKECSAIAHDEKALLNDIDDSVQNAKCDLNTDKRTPKESESIAGSRGEEEQLGNENPIGTTDGTENEFALKQVKATNGSKYPAQKPVDKKHEKQASRLSKTTPGASSSSAQFVFAAPSFAKNTNRSFSSSRHLAIPSYLKHKRK